MNTLHCYETSSSGLSTKGIQRVLDCPIHGVEFRDVDEIYVFVKEFTEMVFPDLRVSPAYENSEPIGYTHTLHRFRILLGDRYIGIRVVVRETRGIRVLYTIPRDIFVYDSVEKTKYSPLGEDTGCVLVKEENTPPGQVYIDIPIVYTVTGVPEINVSKWSLRVGGSVESPRVFTLSDLYELGVESRVVDFHCVTGWSVRGLEFTGVPFSKIIELVKPRRDVKWIYVKGLDGYSAVVFFDDVSSSDSMIALEMNNKPLSRLHGYPARLIIPSLYGWKSVKWLEEIVFTGEYRDGYWEALGYHPRGRVWCEERFKNN